MRWIVVYGPGGFGEDLNKQTERRQEDVDESWNPFANESASSPQIYAPKQPPLSLENQIVYKHYAYLCTEKRSGMAEMPIPVTAIHRYAKEILGFGHRQTEIFTRRVMAFDAAFMAARREQREAQESSKGKNR